MSSSSSPLPVDPRPKAQFHVTGPGTFEPRDVTIEPSADGFLMGRAADNDLSLPNSQISRQHARIFWQEGAFFLEDLNSSNGAWINDSRVRPRTPTPLRPGDVIRVGPFTLTFIRMVAPPPPLPLDPAARRAAPEPEPTPPDEPKSTLGDAVGDKALAGGDAAERAALTQQMEAASLSEAASVSDVASAPDSSADGDDYETDAGDKSPRRSKSSRRASAQPGAPAPDISGKVQPPSFESSPVVSSIPDLPPGTVNGGSGLGAGKPTTTARGDEYPPGVPRRRSTWLEYLPAIYSDDEFIGRYLLICESIFAPIVWNIDNFDLYLTPDIAPPAWLQWMASWFDLLIIPDLPVERQRAILSQIGWLFLRRGTKVGLERLLELYFGVRPEIIENRNEPCHFVVRLALSKSETRFEREVAERLIASQKPAFASHTLEIS